MTVSPFIQQPCWLLSLSLFFLVTTQTQLVKADYKCDESKCRGERIHPWVDDDTEYTCWVKVLEHQSVDKLDAPPEELMAIFEEEILMDPLRAYCADGYTGRLVKEVPPQEVDGEMRMWYTCCPSDPEERYWDLSKEVVQTCSDSACSSPDWTGGGNCWADGFQEPMSCSDSTFRYARYTGLQSLIYVQFLCCDAPQVDDAFMDELLTARIIWVTLSCITLLVCTVFIVALLRDPQARKDGYNLYLVFLAIPDALANFMIILRNALAISGLPVSPTIFIFVASFEYFYAVANMWLNAIIVGTIHHVLVKSSEERTPSGKKKKTIPPPSPKKVGKQTALVYTLSLIVFGWAFFLYIHGLNVFNLVEVVKVWIGTRVVVVAPPILYVIYICFDVWIFDRLPISGRTRVLALYFMRVIVVFLVTWVPYFILYEVAWNITHNRWMVYCSYYLGSIQGTLSVMVALSKPDVKRVFWDHLYCTSPSSAAMDAAKQERKKANDDNPTTVHDVESDDDLAPLPTKRMFGAPTKADKLWEEDDFWGGEDDLLERVMAGEIEAESYVPSEVETTTMDRQDSHVTDFDDETTFNNRSPGTAPSE